MSSISGLDGLLICQDIEIRPHADEKSRFVRPFDHEVDALYIPGDKWKEFCQEPLNSNA